MNGKKWAVGILVGTAACCSLALAQSPSQVVLPDPPVSNAYALTIDSMLSMSVPRGEVFYFEMSHSKVFIGTKRTIAVYVPSEYKADKPACVYVGLDGLGFNVPTVFDNLIAKHEMPVTIAIGIPSGVLDSKDGSVDPRFNRSFEFDSLNDRLARFIVNEVLPAVESHVTHEGRKIILSTNPNDRAIGGASTGGIGAFTVAWERPDQFRRVFTAIGTFVGMRGGDQYYVLVRKTEPKPIRIFMQDGIHDEWPGGPEMGDWWMSNQTMQRALSFAGYDVQHVWGAGTHDGNQAAAIFPQAMKWLWRDWPAPMHSGISGNPVLRSILKPNADWRVVAANCPTNTYIAANPQGKTFYWDKKEKRIAEIPTSSSAGHCPNQDDAGSDVIVFDADGNVYEGDNGKHKITMMLANGGKAHVVAVGIDVNGIAVTHGKDLYATSPNRNGSIWLIRKNKQNVLLESDLKEPTGIALSPDGLWMFVAQRKSRLGYSYRIKADGTLDAGEPFYHFYVPPSVDDSGASSVWMDANGFAYVATRAGVQIFDRNGRVAAILQLPSNIGASSLCFGGDGFHTLYVSAGNKIYAKELNATGIPAWSPLSKLPPWGPG